MQQLGETTVAMATMAIAIHTFVVMWMRKGANNLRVALFVIAAQWTFVLLFCSIAVGTKGASNYYDPTPVRNKVFCCDLYADKCFSIGAG